MRATAAELGRGVEAGAIDPRDLAEAFLDAIAAQPESGRIYARLTPERARADAEAAAGRARAGLRRGPLDGVPISWKDLFDVAGVATEGGSALLAGRIAGHDAALVARAARAGLVCLGKTHQTELAFSGLGINPSTATPPNVHDAARAPGGSSSGAAASVAFGLAAAAIGSDTGGSVRVPAAWNDLVGFKPAQGLLPMGGALPLAPRFDAPGPICRSVEDAALLFAVLAAAPPADLGGARIAGARLLVLEPGALGADPAPEPAAAVEAAAARLAAAGAEVARGAPEALAPALALAPTVFAAEAYAVWGATIEADPEAMFPPVRERFRAGAAFSAVDYLRAWTRLGELRAAWGAAVAGFDAVLTPTTPNLPPEVAALVADHAAFAAENLLTLRNTRVANLLGLCALTLPIGAPACGLMAMAAPGAEARLLRLGAAIEAALA
jgi:aspartyl-tRNA(Asn)/glutamyl-tRNA(Gln) amidotransferase subunit A